MRDPYWFTHVYRPRLEHTPGTWIAPTPYLVLPKSITHPSADPLRWSSSLDPDDPPRGVYKPHGIR
jgi:hypothetical protein